LAVLTYFWQETQVDRKGKHNGQLDQNFGSKPLLVINKLIV